MSKIQLLVLLLSGISFLYFIGILIYIGNTSRFYFIWLFAGIILGIFGIYFERIKESVCQLPAGIRYLSCFVIIILVLVFVITESIIIYHSNKSPEAKADVVIILGAQVNKKEVSLSLKYRLDAAIIYLKKNPGAKVIVSGGKGSGEEITEAEAMKQYLRKKDISENRIQKEENSTSTYENLTYCQKMIGKEDKVVIVSNAFHIFRAKRLAQKLGYKNVEGLPAKNAAFLSCNYYVREAFAVVKEWMLKRI